MKNQRKCSKKFEGLSHAEEFSLFGHQMVESQDNLKECEGLLDQFLEHYAAAIAQPNAAIAQEALGSPCGDDDEARVRRRQRGGRVLVRPPSLSSSDEDEAMAHHRKCFEEVRLEAGGWRTL